MDSDPRPEGEGMEGVGPSSWWWKGPCELGSWCAPGLRAERWLGPAVGSTGSALVGGKLLECFLSALREV